MTWASIRGFDGIYEVSNCGLVRRIGKKILKSYTRPKGYSMVSLCKKGVVSVRYVHRLVAIAFVENSENKKCVNHKDGIKHNNNSSNLEWCSHVENMQHAEDIGLMNRAVGERCANTKLTTEQARRIKYELGDLQNSVIAKMFGVTKNHVSLIRNGVSWRHV